MPEKAAQGLRRPNVPLLVIVMCWLSYFCAYLGRGNYGACLVQIIADTGSANAEAGLVSSFFYAAYGIGQVINGLLARRTDAVRMIGLALALSAVLNFVMPALPNVVWMKYVWALNGFVQSALWPNIIKTFAEMLPDRVMPKGVVAIHTVGASGTVGIFLIASLFLHFFDWQGTFYLAGAAMAVMAVIWVAVMGYCRKNRPARSDVPQPDPDAHADSRHGLPFGRVLALFAASGMLVAFLGAASNGALRDGITVWMPTYLKSVFGASSALAVFISAAVPAAQICGAFIAGFALKKIRDPMLSAALFFGVALLSVLALLVFDAGLIVTCVLFALAATMMTSVNTMLVSSMPLRLGKYGLAALAAGIANAIVYLGSTLASTGFGALSDHYGWRSVLIAMLGCAAASAVVFLLGAIIHRRHLRREAAAALGNE